MSENAAQGCLPCTVLARGIRECRGNEEQSTARNTERLRIDFNWKGVTGLHVTPIPDNNHWTSLEFYCSTS